MKTKRAINFRYIFYPFLMFLFGITVARSLYSGEAWAIVIVLLLLLPLGGMLIYHKHFKILALLFAFFFIGNGFYFLGELSARAPEYSGLVSVTGRVSDDYEEGQYFAVAVIDHVKINGEEGDKIEVRFSRGGDMPEVGDIVSFEAELTNLPLFSLGSLNSSIYRAGISYSCNVNTQDIVIMPGSIHFDEQVRLKIKDALYSRLSEENAGIAYAVLFGDKSGLGFEVKTAYQNSGIVHLLTVSGLHVGFLISLVYGFLKLCRANKYVAFGVTTAVILAYSFLCGMAPSVVRAGVMGIIVMLAGLFGRRYDSLNSLGASGFIILIFSPLTAFDIGFLMSLSCVCGIVLLYPTFIKLFKRIFPYWAAQYIAVSLSAQLAILPFLAAFSSTFNLLSFVVNLLVVPLFSILFPYLFVTAFLSAMLPFMSFSLVPVGWGLAAIAFTASIFANTTAQFKLRPFHFVVTAFFFLMVYALSQFVLIKPINRFFLTAASVLCLCCSFGFTSMRTFKSQAIYLYSYGQESIMLLSESGQSMLIEDNFLLEKSMSLQNVDQLDFYLTLGDMSETKAQQLDEYGFLRYFCANGDNSKDSIEEVDTSKIYFAGDFTFRYLPFDDKILGAYISFDQHDIFVVADINLNYNNLDQYKQTIKLYSPDMVFVGENTALADESFLTVSSCRGESVTFDFPSQGNMAFLWSTEKLTVRRID